MKLGTVVLLKGWVQGMDREAECEILARRLPVPADPGAEMSRIFTYTDCSIVGAPEDLPDGEYLAWFEGYSFAVSLRRGFWFTRGQASPPVPHPVYPLYS